MKRYNPTEIEPKWQKVWADEHRYQAPDASDKPKYYVTSMFPYPSGAGMHTGHFFEHSIVDAEARFRRSLGFSVTYPMGWDSFGLPAENYAIKTGRQPAETTKENIANFKNQLTRVGASIDWSREINTANPEYYKWTQWIFTQLFERGLAYQKEANQWWCPKDKTVLANEQVINGGHCWRCDSLVIKKPMKQWFFKITDYADALLEEIPALDWPQKIKTAQENWIGRSEGAEINYAINGRDDEITVFSTRPDTIFGATFIVLAPEHPLARELVSDETREMVNAYIDEAIKRSEIERSSENKDKTGVFTGSHAINPANGEKVQIWIADYVLGGYGTGAVMGVPAHDERDFAFAEAFKLPVIEVVERPDNSSEECYHGEGTLINSGSFTGQASSDAREAIVAWLEQEGHGHSKVTYKMRD
ncbi:MAG TPA: leucine--tRNA ligase, partial [Candidatus Saccharimonadales bacterium]|nr:leucine--tRNA ligase [Candidatus Saccharimonadales bacterium]